MPKYNKTKGSINLAIPNKKLNPLFKPSPKTPADEKKDKKSTLFLKCLCHKYNLTLSF